jgi:hypothetical protein
LLDDLATWPGRALISHELLAGLRPPNIERLVGLFHPRPVQLILGVRDLSEVVPATFQERAKNQMVESWTEYIDGVRRGPAGKHSFWQLQNVPAVLRRWRPFIPPEQIHVVTVAHRSADSDIMLGRFAEVLGVTLPLDVPTARTPTNRSLGSSELRLLQEVNKVTRERLSWNDYHRLIKFGLVSNILSAFPNEERVRLGESERPWIEAQTAKTTAAINRLGCHIIGDLGELGPWGLTDQPHDPGSVSCDAVVKTAAAALVDLAVAKDVRRGPQARPGVERTSGAQGRTGLIHHLGRRPAGLLRRLRRRAEADSAKNPSTGG